MDIGQVREGANMTIDVYSNYGTMFIQTMAPVGSRKRIELHRIFLFSFSLYSITTVLPEQLRDLALNFLGIAGSKFIFEFNEGGGEFNAGCYARDMERYGFYIDQCAQFVTPSLVRYANMEIYGQATNRYEVWCAHAAKLGTNFYFTVLNALPLMYGNRFPQMCNYWHVGSVNDADAAVAACPPFPLTWTATRDGKTVFNCLPETLALLTKVLIAVKLPELVGKEDAVELVPSAEGCRWLQDR
jgi:hypothetical protein